MVKRFIRKIVHRVFWRRLFNKPETKNGAIFTTVGWMAEGLLQKKAIRAATPCGKAYATEYYLDGRLVRRDVTQVVERGMPPIELFTQTQGQQGQGESK